MKRRTLRLCGAGWLLVWVYIWAIYGFAAALVCWLASALYGACCAAEMEEELLGGDDDAGEDRQGD